MTSSQISLDNMPDPAHSLFDHRHVSTDDRCVLLAEAVKYFADHIQQTISNNWEYVCEAIADELALSSSSRPAISDRSDLNKFIELLGEARVGADKLAKLPVALGAVSTFSDVVENFWTSVNRRLRSALRDLGPRPTAIPDSISNVFDLIVAEHACLIAAASLVISSGSYSRCTFPPHIERFLHDYAGQLEAGMARLANANEVSLSDPSFAVTFVDKEGIAELFTWFGHKIEVSSVKEYTRTDREKPPHGTSPFPPSEAHAASGHHQYLYRVSSVVEWLSANKVKLHLSDMKNLPSSMNFFCESDGTAILGPPPRKPK